MRRSRRDASFMSSLNLGEGRRYVDALEIIFGTSLVVRLSGSGVDIYGDGSTQSSLDAWTPCL